MGNTEQNDTAQRFRRVAAELSRTIAAVPDDLWENPSPCDQWCARDVLAHLIEWIPGPGFMLGTYGIDTGPIPSVEVDPSGAWKAVADAVQSGLDDPEIAERVEDCGPAGSMSFAAAVDLMCTPDVLIHTWDIATAANLDVVLDPEEMSRQAARVQDTSAQVDTAMRASGMFGPRVAVPANADATTRVLAFFGRSALT